MSAEYKKFDENPEKEERRKAAPSSLGVKRFLLSDNPELLERIKNLKRVTKEMKLSHPEIISFGLFGSLVKGYAIKESDIDLYVYIDEERLRQKPDYPADSSQIQDFRINYLKLVNDELVSRLSLSGEQVNARIEILNKDEMKKFSNISQPSPNWSLFLLNTSRDIEEYRKIILDSLEGLEKELPGLGNSKWKKIMDEVFEFENFGLPPNLQEERRKRYPQTLAEAKGKFLGGSGSGA